MYVMTKEGVYVRMYGAVVSAIRSCIGRQARCNHQWLADILMASYQRDSGEMLSETSVGRWQTGARPVPMRIADYYATDSGRAAMRADITAHLIPVIIAPDTLMADIIQIMDQSTVDPTVRRQLLLRHPDMEGGDLATVLVDVLVYAMQCP